MIVSESELKVSAQEWECYHKTPPEIVDLVNNWVHLALKQFSSPVVTQRIIFEGILDSVKEYGFYDSEGCRVATNIINQFYHGPHLSRFPTWVRGTSCPEVTTYSDLVRTEKEQILGRLGKRSSESVKTTDGAGQKQSTFDLSEEAVNKVAKAIAPDVLRDVFNSDSFVEFLTESITAKVVEAFNLPESQRDSDPVIDITSGIIEEFQTLTLGI